VIKPPLQEKTSGRKGKKRFYNSITLNKKEDYEHIYMGMADDLLGKNDRPWNPYIKQGGTVTTSSTWKRRFDPGLRGKGE